MIGRKTPVELRALFVSDEDVRGWMSPRSTPAARTRVRRWVRVENVAMTTIVVGAALMVLAPVASIAVAVWSTVTDIGRPDLYWWIWGIAIGVFACGMIAWVIATSRRVSARYADGHVSVGTVDRAVEHPGEGDDHTWYDLRISADLPDGTTLHRRLQREGEGLDRRVGGRIRFRHDTLDPDDVHDVHFAGWPDKKRRRRRERSDR
ncbi:hypothetical protein [Gordonia humi]|uniref:Uncharacterized protein n=1 Tax=Gordonia humi TaxID=686429 RepID=A0A840FA28_9ACTN|nr:hypothetical protein [Gordonia humi]MBB4136367.1 hypothetical protein [Gordonia humi]